MDEKIKERILDLRKKGYSIDQISSEIGGVYRWEIQDILMGENREEEILEEEIDDEDEIYEKEEKRRYFSGKWKSYFNDIDLQKRCCDLRYQGFSYNKIGKIIGSNHRGHASMLVLFRQLRLEEKRKLLEKIREISKRIGIPESEYSKYDLSYIEFRDLNLQRLRFSKRYLDHNSSIKRKRERLGYGLHRLGYSFRRIDRLTREFVRIPARSVGKYILIGRCRQLIRRDLFEDLENIIKDFDQGDDKNNREDLGSS